MMHTTRFPTATVAVICLGLSLGTAACQRQPETLQVSRRFDELLQRAEQRDPVSTAQRTTITVNNEIRPVIAQLRQLARVDVQLEPGAPTTQQVAVPDVDGEAAPLPEIAAAVRTKDGPWQPRHAVLDAARWKRSVAVQLLDTDVGRPLELLVTGWGPPSLLDVMSDEFTVPSNARLRFGTLLTATAAAGRAEFSVSIQSARDDEAVLYEHTLETRGAGSDAAWEDRDVSLADYAGRTARLRFEIHIDAGSGSARRGALPKAFFSEPVLLAPAPRPQPADSVVLISIDTLRADHLGAYGNARPVSPTIDRLAAQATLFENVIAVWPETSASHMTLFTSLYPSVHGIGITVWGGRQLPAWQLTLTEILRQHGFVTGAVTEDGLLFSTAGFARGFDTYQEFPPAVRRGAWVQPHPIDGQAIAGNEGGKAKHVFALGDAWLRHHADDSFFLFLHTYQVHQRDAPEPRFTALRQSFVGDHRQPEITDANSFVATYDASIAYTDELVGSLLRTLDELNLTRRTLLIVTSDHGEEFFEHGLFGHGATLYDPALRVPLIISCPGVIPAGKRIPTQISLIDLAPTLLDLLQLPPLAQAQGRSAADLIRGSASSPRGPVFCELGDHQRAVRTDDAKLIRIAGDSGVRTTYYDLRRDAGEKTPATDVDGTPEAQEALRVLREHDLECQALRDRLQAAAAHPAAPATVPLDEETRQRLRALGYTVPDEK